MQRRSWRKKASPAQSKALAESLRWVEGANCAKASRFPWLHKQRSFSEVSMVLLRRGNDPKNVLLGCILHQSMHNSFLRYVRKIFKLYEKNDPWE